MCKDSEVVGHRSGGSTSSTHTRPIRDDVVTEESDGGDGSSRRCWSPRPLIQGDRTRNTYN